MCSFNYNTIWLNRDLIIWLSLILLHYKFELITQQPILNTYSARVFYYLYTLHWNLKLCQEYLTLTLTEHRISRSIGRTFSHTILSSRKSLTCVLSLYDYNSGCACHIRIYAANSLQLCTLIYNNYQKILGLS